MSRLVAPKAATGRGTAAVLAGSAGLTRADACLAVLTVTSGPTLNTAALPPGVSVLGDFSIAPDETRRAYVLRYIPPEAAALTDDVTLPLTGTTHWVLLSTRIRDADPDELLDIALTEAGSRNTATSGGTLTAPGFTPTRRGVRALYFFVKRNVTTSANISAGGDSVVTVARCNGDGSNGQVGRLCTELLDSTDPVAPRTATSGSDTANGWVAVTVAVRPRVSPVALWWEADAETQDFSAYMDTGPGTGGIDYLAPQVRDVVAAPAGMSGSAYRFTINGVASNSTQRCESRAAAASFTEAAEAWIAGRTWLPAGFPVSPGSWQLVAQLKNDGSGSPPLALHIEQGEFQLQGGGGHPSGPAPMPARDLGDAVAEVVDEWLWHVVFSSDPLVGQVSIWRNGALLVDGYRPPGGTLYPGQASFLKTGCYRDPALAAPVAVVHDGWRIGATRAAVELAPPPGPVLSFLPFFPDRLVVI